MDLGEHVKREDMDLGYACKSRKVLFCHNTGIGEHRWPKNSPHPENSILRVQASDVPDLRNELCSVATQTEDYGCVNQCTSMYVDNERQMKNRESESNKIKEEVSDEVRTIDVNEQNTFNNTDVEENLHEVSEDYEMDESLSTIVTKIIENVPNVQTKHVNSTKSYDCSYCSKTFKWKTNLVVHVRTHTGEKPYECSYCDKAFTQNASLKCHLLLHTGEKPFEYWYRDKAFAEKAALNTHLRTHTGEKPFECSSCDKAFTTKTKLKIHLRTHTGEKPYECSYCDKAFARKGDLNRHLRTHTYEKPYECSYCDKAFSQKNHLNDHQRTHTGEKPYECVFCDKAFARKTSLKIHLHTHISDNPDK